MSMSMSMSISMSTSMSISMSMSRRTWMKSRGEQCREQTHVTRNSADAVIVSYGWLHRIGYVIVHVWHANCVCNQCILQHIVFSCIVSAIAQQVMHRAYMQQTGGWVAIEVTSCLKKVLIYRRFLSTEGSYLQKVLIYRRFLSTEGSNRDVTDRVRHSLHYLGVKEVAVRTDDSFIHHYNTARLG
jgi:hypothetical protein